MRRIDRSLVAHAARVAVVLALFGTPAWAVDGVIEINQARALAGGVTPSDQPGFPVTINAAGSYRLTGPLSVGVDNPNTSAISVVSSSGVTIDLNGFAIAGPSSCTKLGCTPSGTAVGIDGSGSFGVTVRNGTVRGWPGGGIDLASRGRIEDVTSIINGGSGLRVGDNSIITHCSAGSNASNGIQTGSASMVEGNTADNNAQSGILVSNGSVVTNNTAAGNQTGIAGFTSSLRGNGVRTNTNSGISCTGCSLVGNVAQSNTGVGFSLDAGSGYSQNTLHANNGGDANVQVSSGVDFGQNICGAPIACP